MSRMTKSQWGNPKQPKYYAGPSNWSPWNQDFSWKSTCKRENELYEKQAAAAEVKTLEGLDMGAVAVKANPALARSMSANALGEVLTAQAQLRKELRDVKHTLSHEYHKEARARLEAQRKLEAQVAERQELAAELEAYKKMMTTVKQSRSPHKAAAGAPGARSPTR